MINFSLAAFTLHDLFSNADEIGDSLGLLGALMVASIGGPAGFDAMTQDGELAGATLSALMSIMPNPNKHHTIPVYMCGARRQDYAHIGYSDHAALHAKLYLGVLGIKAVTEVYVKKYLKKPGAGGRQPTDPIVLLAKKENGSRGYC